MRFFLFDHNRLNHGFKTALACLIGFIVTKSIHLPVDQWLIITILVVMCAQLSMGSIIQKSYMRFFGTLTGSIIAALTLVFFSHNILAFAIAVSLSAFFFSYIATGRSAISESGTLGAVTVTIILIGHNPTLAIAMGRFLEISAGILIAAFVSQFVMPIHARRVILSNQAQTLRGIKKYYTALLIANEDIDESIENQDESLVKLLITQRKLAIDASHELFGVAFNNKQFKNSLWREKEIIRSITFMHHAFNASQNVKKFLSDCTLLQEFHRTICEALEKMAESIEKNNFNLMIILPSVKSLKDKIDESKNSLENDLIYIHTFLFCAEILINRMEELLLNK